MEENISEIFKIDNEYKIKVKLNSKIQPVIFFHLYEHNGKFPWKQLSTIQIRFLRTKNVSLFTI
jgi:hypothetical protein